MKYPHITPIENQPLNTCSSDELVVVQRALEWLIYNPGPIDGLYGTKTATAWSEFKRVKGLGNPDWIGPDSIKVCNDLISQIADILDNTTDVRVSIEKLAPLMRMPYHSQICYIWATVQWETAGTWEPVKEAYWVNNAEQWRKDNLRYYPYYGRGYVQLTWESNYQKYETILEDPLVDNPDNACEHDVALFVLVHGFATGTFTGRKLSDYVYTEEPKDYYNARRCINGTDKATEIADIARAYYANS